MRRPNSAFSAALVALGLSAPVASAQTFDHAPPVTSETNQARAASSFDAMVASRGARYLLRNGLDYINYKEYGRALRFLRAAEARQSELEPPEVKALKTGIEDAQRGLRETGASGGVANRARPRTPGAMAAATTSGPSRRPAQARSFDSIQLTAATQSDQASPSAPSSAVAPAVAMTTSAADPGSKPAGMPAPAMLQAEQPTVVAGTTATPTELPEPPGRLPEPGPVPASKAPELSDPAVAPVSTAPEPAPPARVELPPLSNDSASLAPAPEPLPDTKPKAQQAPVVEPKAAPVEVAPAASPTPAPAVKNDAPPVLSLEPLPEVPAEPKTAAPAELPAPVPAPAETKAPASLPEVPAETKAPAVLPEVPAETKAPAVLPEVPAETKAPALLPEVPAETKAPALLPEVPAETKAAAPAELPAPAPAETKAPAAELPVLAPAETKAPAALPEVPVEPKTVTPAALPVPAPAPAELAVPADSSLLPPLPEAAPVATPALTPDATPASAPAPAGLPDPTPVPTPDPASTPAPAPAATPVPAAAEGLPALPEATPTPGPSTAPVPTPAATSTPTPPPAPAAEELPVLPGATAVPTTSAAVAPTTPTPTPSAEAANDPYRLPRQPLNAATEEAIAKLAQRQTDEAKSQVGQPSALPRSVNILPPPPSDEPNPADNMGISGNTSTRFELTRAPSPTEAWPIRRIPVPEEFVPIQPRNWDAKRKYWQAPAFCHQPLYFQDAALERYGHSVEQFFGPTGRFLSYPIDDPKESKLRMQIVQPFWSIGLFAFQVGTLPYKMFVDPPWEAEYDLGYYRPGDRIPTDMYYLPLHGVGQALPPIHGRNW